MQGTLAVSAQPTRDGRGLCFIFRDVRISEIGEYKLKISVMSLDGDMAAENADVQEGARVNGEVISDGFKIIEGEVPEQAISRFHDYFFQKSSFEYQNILSFIAAASFLLCCGLRHEPLLTTLSAPEEQRILDSV
jgi:hypothetical protein